MAHSVTTVTIPTANLAKFEAKFEKIARRANKLNVQGAYAVKVGPAYTITEKENGIERDYELQDFEVFGQRPVVTGYTFVAKIDLSEDFPVIRTSPEFDAPIPARYREGSTECAHCNTHRERHNVFVVRNDETGDFMQVGRNCLADFVGSADAASAIAGYFTMLDDMNASFEISEDGDERFFGGIGNGRDFYTVTPETLMAVTVAVVDQFGWLSAGNAYEGGGKPTKAYVQEAIWPHSVEEKRFAQRLVVADAHKQLGAKIIAWVAENMGTESDYAFNVTNILKGKRIQWRNVGIACSAIVAYQRAIEETNKKVASDEPKLVSEYVGEIKVRSEFTAKLDYARTIDTFYGPSVLHKFVTDAGEMITWFKSNSNKAVCEVGETITFKATPKKHELYNGEKQTIVSRLTVTS